MSRILIRKARAGFSRGGGRGHKYWKRVRVMRRGKAAWRYYYDTPADRKAYMEQQARKVGAARDKVAALAELHRDKADFAADHPELRAAKIALRELNSEYVTDLLSWAKPPTLALSSAVEEQYHKAMLDLEEPDDPVGKKLSPWRALEMSYQRMPPVILKNFSGCIKQIALKASNEDEVFAKGAAGYHRPGTREISVDYPTCQQIAMGRGAKMKGGLFQVECIVHEMAHAIHHQLGTSKDRKLPADYDGPNWDDWVSFMETTGKHEPGVTGYAETNIKERFAESFAAALMFPQQLAETAPECYEWFRGFLGAEAMRPLTTDPNHVDSLREQQAAAMREGDGARASEIGHLLNMATGILDMDEEDTRLQWWKGQETVLQQMLRESGEPDYTDVYKDSADQFYEMSVGGRTLFMRIGPPSPTRQESGWTPREGKRNASGRVIMRAADIKEIYDETGKPLTNDNAFWHLMQDAFSDDHPTVQKMLKAGGLSGQYLNKHLQYLAEKAETADKAKTPEDRAKVWKARAGRVNYSETMVPVAITAETFAQRSGAFAYGNWGMAGESEHAQLRTETDPDRRKALLDAFKKKQPGVERHTPRGPGGRFMKSQIVQDQLADGEQPVPRMHAIRYVNDNPDGTKTVIEVERSESGSSRGHFFIADPMWRALLTPNGEAVKSAEHLAFLCKQAASSRRRTWVSIKTDTRKGDTPHYYHVEVEFDGRGQPRIRGDEWKRRLGKVEPRIDDLLTSGRIVDGAEVGRAMIKAQAIKMERAPKPKKGRAKLPILGQAVILDVAHEALGRRPPSPPGWDRMPPGQEFPEDPKGAKNRLNAVERRLKREGLLPEHYRGTIEQRRWLGVYFQPMYDEFERSSTRPVSVVLSSLIPGKAAGEIPPPPGWDRMPEGFQGPPEDSEGKKRRLTKKERELKKTGQLPAWYRGTAAQREWFKDDFARALSLWEDTKEEETAKELPPRYVFIAAAGSGFPGKVIVKYGESDVIRSIRNPIETRKPRRLESDTLVYLHQELHPITGKVVEDEVRLLLPKDGSVSWQALEGLHGVTILNSEELEVNPFGTAQIRVNLDGFAKLRDHLGGMSLTGEAEQRIRAGAETLREAAKRQKREQHAIEIEDLDIGRLASGSVPGFGNVGLNPVLPNGREFELAFHQKELLQLAVDNGGRALAAHYMGTGKTISAISLAKLMHARRDPENPTQPDPNAPKKTLIVAPLNTVEQWRQAADDFDDGITVVGADRTNIPIDEYLRMLEEGTDTNDLVVCGPQYFTIHQEKLRKAGFDGLIVDEAHQGVKNELSQRNAAIREWNADMKMLFLMTGTPITTSPADILEYVKMLSNGEQWAGMTREQFVDEYLEESPIPAELGLGKKGPKLQVKPEKRAELAAIVAQWTHVAMPKDVRGKTLPAVRIEENKHAEMVGTQALLYSYYMAALSEGDRARLSANRGLLADDETAGLDSETRRRVQAAKAVANCVAYKPASNEEFITVTREVPVPGGKTKKEKTVFRTFDPVHLMARKDVPQKIRKKLAGRWPTMEEIGKEQAAIYDNMGELREVLGSSYSELQGTRITPAQIKAMKAAGWPKTVRNPDNGPLGIICRGSDTPRTDAAYLDRVDQAMRFQRRYGILLSDGIQVPGKRAGTFKVQKFTPGQALDSVRAEFGISEDEARLLLGTRPNDHDHHGFIDGAELGMPGVRVEEGHKFFSDPSGSLHRLYREDDWDMANNRPKPGAPSLLDPGRREDRRKADLMMVHGNAKALELRAHVQRFHTTTGTAGPDGARQMVMFANGILDGCRTMEATLRTMGFKDVNEALEGSVEYDEDDPDPGNGKYFVTYIGSTYTGSRDLNAEIFKKRKDKLGRDTAESLFVHKTTDGRAWRAFPGAEAHGSIRMSQWLPEQREAIRKQFQIKAPESFYIDDSGVQMYFYGNKASGDILRQITLTGNPAKMADPDKAAAALAKINALQAQYEAIVRTRAVPDPPLSGRQRAVFNNCELIICSDAANVGLNFGNAVESVNYDTLGSPALEWQRITRSARMLPPAVEGRLMGKPVKVPKTRLRRDEQGDILRDSDGKALTEEVVKDGKPVLIDLVDEKGNTVRDDTGVVSKLRKLEADLFAPTARGSVSGLVHHFGTADTHPEDGPISFQQALNQIVSYARGEAGATKNPDHRELWIGIANKAQVAHNLGVNAAAATLDELSQTKAPGSVHNVIEFGDLTYEQPTAGTYDDLQVGEASRALHDAIMNHPQITDEDRRALAEAGYAMADDGGNGTLDATAVYLSIRAAEILDYVGSQREVVSGRMRAAAGGAVVQDSDVTNAIIDSLTPMDRAILKTKKYLVNVRRVGVSTHMPQTVNVRTVNEESGDVENKPVFVGYAKEHPISTEANTRAMQRARQTAYEQLLFDIQNETPFKTDLDYEETDAAGVANASRQDVVKGRKRSVRLTLRLGV